MNISNAITEMIIEMLEEKNEIEFQRNILAQSLGCVPSQINYVLSSRFTPESGFLVESRRGGGGCIKITRLSYNKDSLLSEEARSEIIQKLCEIGMLRTLGGWQYPNHLDTSMQLDISIKCKSDVINKYLK